MPILPAYFKWKGILIRQDEAVHKVGTDAILLGSWIPTIISDASSIMDVGTGSGVLALWMARCFPESTICAVDIDHKAIALAKLNIENSIYTGKVEAVHLDILEGSSDTSQYDLIICNPPYHPELVFPREEFKRLAKHISSSTGEWMNGLIRRLLPDGHLMLIVPYESAATWIESANKSGLYNLNRLDVFSFEQDHKPKRTLLHLTRRLAKPDFDRLVIYHEDKTYTTEYIRLTGISQEHKPLAEALQ